MRGPETFTWMPFGKLPSLTSMKEKVFWLRMVLTHPLITTSLPTRSDPFPSIISFTLRRPAASASPLAVPEVVAVHMRREAPAGLASVKALGNAEEAACLRRVERARRGAALPSIAPGSCGEKAKTVGASTRRHATPKFLITTQAQRRGECW